MLRDPPWSVALAPGAPSGTFLDHNFPWCLIQEEPSCKLQKSCKENQSVVGEGNFQRAPDQK